MKGGRCGLGEYSVTSPCGLKRNVCCVFQSLLGDFTRFSREDIPPRLAEKQRLGDLFLELQVGDSVISVWHMTGRSYSRAGLYVK